MPLPEPAIELVKTFMKARRALREGLARSGWHPRFELHRLTPDSLGQTRYRLSSSYDPDRDAAYQATMLETFRGVLAQEVYGRMRGCGMLEVRSVAGCEQGLLARPGRAARDESLIQDLGLGRMDEAQTLGRAVMQFLAR
jgi:hypothetical protein